MALTVDRILAQDATVTSTSVESRSLDVEAAAFAALGDPVRLRILRELAGGRRCVCELLERIPVAPNLLSYHLKVLRKAGLVLASRRGRWIDYRLSGRALTRLRAAVPGAGAP